jgi:HrpA-like RNA helicase
MAEKIHLEHISDIHNNEHVRDILIFVQGVKQIMDIEDAIHRLNTEVFIKGFNNAVKHLKTRMEAYGGEDIYLLAPIGITSEKLSKGGEAYKQLFGDIENICVDVFDYDEHGKRLNKIKRLPASRRVIIATNAIETGMTIDTLKYCIDSGFVKESIFNPNYGCLMLLDKNVNQASSEQRKGRIGRKAPGVFYAAYTEQTLNATNKDDFPEIVKGDITAFMLDIIINETDTVIEEQKNRTGPGFQMNILDQIKYNIIHRKPFYAHSLDMIQYPSYDNISCAMEKLHGLGLITHEYLPTIFGVYANQFRILDMEAIRMILAGYSHGANILDLITIACFAGTFRLMNRQIYKNRNPLRLSEEEADYYSKIIFADDFIEYLFIWDEFMSILESVGNQLESTKKKKIGIGFIENWADRNGLNLKTLFDMVELRDEVIGDMLMMGLNPYYNGLGLHKGKYNLCEILRSNLTDGLEEVRKIKKCILDGYRFNLCIWDDNIKSYKSAHTGVPVIFRNKILKFINHDKFLQKRPKYIVTTGLLLRRSNINPKIFDFSGAEASVMDGFVDIDVNFLKN